MDRTERIARQLHNMMVRFLKDEGVTERHIPERWDDLRPTAQEHYLNEAKVLLCEFKTFSTSSLDMPVLIPKNPHCYHQNDCPVIIEAVNAQREACQSWLSLHLPELAKKAGYVRLAKDQSAPCLYLDKNTGDGKGMVTVDYCNGRASLIDSGFKKVD